MIRDILFFIYPGFVLLDLTGPMEAFAMAGSQAPGSYRLRVVSVSGGNITSSAGLDVASEKATFESADTFIVVGDFSLAHTDPSPEVSHLIQSISGASRRTASVCMGAFLLAASGLLEGHLATTHWRYAARLQMRFPAIRVDGDRIFTNEGAIWTAAGMTSGIDMALAMIAEDLGKDIARLVARLMIVYYQRPGGQYQHSCLLEFDSDCDRMQEVLTFARDNISADLSVEQLADVAHLSVRQFARRFTAAYGITPARAIEQLRVEIARPQVENSFETLDVIARRTGFANADRMRAAFERIIDQTPQEIRRLARVGQRCIAKA